MSDPYFFGYGSLVNTRTHTYPDPVPAEVSGWRRSWRHTSRRPFPFLSVVQDDTCTISGLIARVPENDWAALDLRESGYERLAVTPAHIRHDRGGNAEVQIYKTHAEADITGRVVYPILLSYLDVVVQGFLATFGEPGVADFFTSTEGWDAPVLDDRSAPLYARHQVLSPLERDLVDHHLRRLSSKIEKL